MDLAIAPPLQNRSRHSYESILQATEQLLQTRTFEAIGVAEIVACASVSTGSFYARFASKEALLPVLYDRYDLRMEAKGDALVETIHRARSLGVACRAFVGAIAEVLRDNPNLMIAMAQLARSEPKSATPISVGRRSLHARTQSAMLRFFDGAPQDRSLAAIKAAQFMAVCSLREAILFPHAPFAAMSGLGSDLEGRVALMMQVYLKGEMQ
jgi:AcrR family transcriptional regulator